MGTSSQLESSADDINGTRSNTKGAEHMSGDGGDVAGSVSSAGVWDGAEDVRSGDRDNADLSVCVPSGDRGKLRHVTLFSEQTLPNTTGEGSCMYLGSYTGE
jgi:hypothetical protein